MKLRFARVHAKMPLLLTAAAMVVATASLAEAAETIDVVSPAPPHFAGQPLVFHIQLKGFFQPRQSTVFYRPVGGAVFRKLNLAKETEIDFRGSLPASRSVPPGIEYFISVEDGRGQTYTLPALDPRKNPFRIDIRLDRDPPQIEKTSPGLGEDVQTVRPAFQLSFTEEGSGIDPTSIRLVLDGVDVTGLASFKDNQLKFSPAINLVPGQHVLVVDLADAAGNRMPPQEISFSVVSPGQEDVIAGLDRASAEVYWDAEAAVGLLSKKDTAQSDWRLQSSATVRSIAEKDKLRSSLDANVWYFDEEKSEESKTWNLNNFLASFAYDDRYTLDLGDITVEGTDLISRSLYRRGGRFSVDLNGTEAQAYMVRSNAVTGFNHLLGGTEENQQIWGGSLAQELLGDRRLVLKANYMTGKNYEPDDYNASNLQPGTEGDVVSLSFSSQVFREHLQLEGEYAASRFDTDISDDRGKESDHALRAKAFGRLERSDWEIGYRYYGPEYASIANPIGTRGREEVNLGGGIRFDESSLRASLLHGRDNVKKDPLLPVIHNTTGTVDYSLTVTDWPAVFISGIQTLQRSSDEPLGVPEIENTTTTVALGANQAGERWQLAPFYSYTRFDDRSTDNDSDTHVFTVAGGIRPTDASSVNPSVTYTHIDLESTGAATRTWQAALSAVVGFWENQVNLNATASWLDNQTLDGAVHTTTWSGICQLNWSVEKYLPGGGRQTLSLRGRYNITDDRVAGSEQEDYILYAVFSVGLPWASR